jgi:pilus assembly protein CpaF
VHANSPADALRRLETLALMAGVGLPHEAIVEQVRRGIDLVVHLQRRPDGSRRVTEIAEVG